MTVLRIGRLIRLASLLAVVAATTANAQDADLVLKGQAVFKHSCAPCHGVGAGDDGRAMLPASQSLQLKYRGEKSQFLEDRQDLPYPVLRTFVRRGSWSMPGFRKTEVSDADVEAIAAYLAQSARRPPGTPGTER